MQAANCIFNESMSVDRMGGADCRILPGSWYCQDVIGSTRRFESRGSLSLALELDSHNYDW